MAIYYCHGCDKCVDNDYHPMEISGLCPECHFQAQEEVPETPKTRQGGVFTADQMAFIKKMEQEDYED